MQTSIRSTTDSTQHGDLPRTENDGGNSWKRLRSSLALARDDDDMVQLHWIVPGKLCMSSYHCDTILNMLEMHYGVHIRESLLIFLHICFSLRLEIAARIRISSILLASVIFLIQK